MKRKGKVHPSPPQKAAPPLHTGVTQDSLSVLNLLPAAIIALSAVLSLQDREVLAYMITRSMRTTTIGSSSINSASAAASSSVHDSKKFYGSIKQMNHQPAVFDCECFDCYTSFWYRWDSSPDRELIHQAIEAFEEHLASGEVQTKRSSNRRGRKKEKSAVQKLEQAIQNPNPNPDVEMNPASQLQLLIDETSPEILDSKVGEVNSTPVAAAASGHRGFARKVLPDLLGVFISRLWNLWGPNC